ncbi:MAG TPA: dTMP kinase [Bryobacteraceae bacterium]|nr:dTMP kinase [Bryobacteraceae bacterium]
MTERRGRFITFEGPDGSGKTTQMRLLAERLRAQGRRLVETQEPGGTGIGLQIRRLLLDRESSTLCPVAEMLLYFAARAQNFDEIILPAWKDGAVVLSDRFTDSTLAYQGAGRGLDEGTVLQLHDIACHGLQPDLTVVIDVDQETGSLRCRERGRSDRIEAQEPAFHNRVREAYLGLARKHPARMRVVDGCGPISEVAERVYAHVREVLP